MVTSKQSIQRFEEDERHQICLLVLGSMIVLTIFGFMPDTLKNCYATFIGDAQAWGSTAPADLAPVGAFLGKWVGGMAIAAPFVLGYWLLYKALGAIRRPS